MRHGSVIVDRRREEPVYAQIARQVRERIATGELAPGTPLPPVRTLASDLGVNLNTVARAYRQLEADGFVEILDRSGARVAPPGAAAEAREALRERLRDLLARLRQAGIGPREIAELTERELRGLGRGNGGKG